MRVVALPTDVLCVVRAEIDPRYVLWARTVGAVARSAEAPIRRFAGAHGVWTRLVFVRRAMTCRAQQCGVVRHRLLREDLAVAGAARFRCNRRLRLMRVVTSDARRQWIVGHRVDLREAGWTGRVVGVTARAELPLARRRRLGFHGIRHGTSSRERLLCPAPPHDSALDRRKSAGPGNSAPQPARWPLARTPPPVGEPVGALSGPEAMVIWPWA
jgi:hypothetical protein